MFLLILFSHICLIGHSVCASNVSNSTSSPDVMLTKIPTVEMITDHRSGLIEYNLDDDNFAGIGGSSTEMLRRKYAAERSDYDEVEIEPKLRQSFAKQIGLPNNPVGLLVNRVPCTCNKGVCGCCTAFILALFRSKACMNITYIPEDFAFEVKMLLNDRVMYKNIMSGRNPRPICIRPPRFDIVELCAVFHDIYFIGRNMHFCLNMEANFQGFELFDRSFNCMRIGDQGVKIVRPEDGGGITHRPSLDAEVDEGSDDIEDYDENVVRNVPEI